MTNWTEADLDAYLKRKGLRPRAPLRKARKMPKESSGEREFALQLTGLGPRIPTPAREYEFAKQQLGRKWRFDFAWPDIEVLLPGEGGHRARRLAVEIESSVHRTKERFAGDVTKYNVAQAMGWLVLRFTKREINSGAAVMSVAALLSPEGGDLLAELQGRKSA